MINGQQDFFSSNLMGRIFFCPSKCSAGYFLPLLISLQYFFSSKRVTYLHIQNVLTFIAVFFFLKTGSTKVCSIKDTISKLCTKEVCNL